MSRCILGWKALLMLYACVITVACASKLDRELTDKKPKGGAVGTAIDTSQMFFRDIQSGKSFSILEYMERNNKDSLLLIFGSQDCVSCGQKAAKLQNHYISKHALYESPGADKFEIIGVNTDRISKRLLKYVGDYPFIRWSDPAGLSMLDHFMPKGKTFSVPLTVLLTRESKLWTLMPDDMTTPLEMMNRVALSLGLSEQYPAVADQADESPPRQGGAEQPLPPPLGVGVDLMWPHKERLLSVKVNTCAREEKSIGELSGESDLIFVQSVIGSCDEYCQENLVSLMQAHGLCANQGLQCRALTLATDSLRRSDCESGMVYQGGSEFFDKFETFFNWDMPLYEEMDPPYRILFEEDLRQTPILMAFNKHGEVVFKSRKTISPAQIASVAAHIDDVVTGFGFEVHDGEEKQSLSRYLRRAKFTIANVFGIECHSCIEEIKHWHENGQLYDFCAARPDECQVLLVETGWYSGSHADRVVELNQQLVDAGITKMKVLLDTQSPDDYLSRIREGYLEAVSPSGGVNQVVLLDREGKLLQAGMLPGENHDFIALLNSYLEIAP